MGEGQGGAGPVARPVTFHPAAHKDLASLDRQDQKRVAATIDSLATDGPGAQTHPLTGPLKGWMSTKASRGHRVIHRDADDGSMHVGYVGLHEYNKAINRLAAADQPCPDCGATGELDDGRECEACDGGGTTPVPHNTQPYQHHHDWLPEGHFFGPGKPGLNPELFDGDHLRPEIRQQVLSLLNHFWTPRYGPDWQAWAKVYLAGSAVSHWWGDNNDLDTLVGVDYPRARQLCRPLSHLTDDEIDTRLTDEFREHLNDDARTFHVGGRDIGPFEQTWYTNSGSYDIRTLRPYAAYDVTADTWAVPPVEVPADFDAHSLPEADWDQLDALRQQVREIASLPDGEREARGAELYDRLHQERHDAFSTEGEGLYAPANVVWKSLDAAPGHPLAQLTEWKKAHDGAETEETAA